MKLKTKKKLAKFFGISTISLFVFCFGLAIYGMVLIANHNSIESYLPIMMISLPIFMFFTLFYSYYSNTISTHRRNLENNRQDHWLEVLTEMADNGDIDKATDLFKRLNFKSIAIENYIGGYLDAKSN